MDSKDRAPVSARRNLAVKDASARQTLPPNTVAATVVPAAPHKAALAAGGVSALVTAGALACGFIVNAAAANAIDSWPHFFGWAKANWIGYLVAQVLAPAYRAYQAGQAAKQFKTEP